ncbi:MAG: hypothetical protein NTW67_04340 [Candidatus Woesearchaeota archaeon]|nr:hypothetical protein [Candidatus Woesearchaeota archaeon]
MVVMTDLFKTRMQVTQLVYRFPGIESAEVGERFSLNERELEIILRRAETAGEIRRYDINGHEKLQGKSFLKQLLYYWITS